MSEGIDIEQCSRTMERAHSRIDSVEKITASIETSAKNIEKNVCEIHNLLYGKNGDDGFIITTKVNTTKLFERIGLHTKIIITVILAIISGFIGMVINSYHHK